MSRRQSEIFRKSTKEVLPQWSVDDTQRRKHTCEMDAGPLSSLTKQQRVTLPRHVIDLGSHSLTTSAGEPVELRRQSLELLCYLASRAGSVVSKAELMDVLWPGVVVTEDSIVQAVGDVRRALGDEAHKVLQTVPRRGYRLIESLPPAPSNQIAAKPASLPRWRRVLAGAAGAALLFGVIAWQPWLPRPPRQDAARAALAVVGSRAGTPEEQQLSQGYAYELVSELSRNADLQVLAAQSGEAVGFGQETPQAVAHKLGAHYLVGISLQQEQDRLRLRAQLVDGRDGRVLWTRNENMAAADALSVRNDLVRHIASSVHYGMRRNEMASAFEKPPGSLDSYVATLRAYSLKQQMSPKGVQEGEALLDQVLAKEPDYAPALAYKSLASTLDATSFYSPRTLQQRAVALQQALNLAERAQVLDPSLPSAQEALALSSVFLGRYSESVTAARRCVELAPSNAECKWILSMVLINSGYPEESLKWGAETMAATPRPQPATLYGWGRVLWANRQFDKALAVYDDCLRQSPEAVGCSLERALTRAEAGVPGDARAELDAVAPIVRNTGRTLEQVAANFYDPKNAQFLIDRRVAAARTITREAESLSTNR
ncbi:MAG: winged helix-turn-helix domain-containing protein [Proteobacteria bacterium]|nr:winged helix-turn-helix domain-containing protein [Pseudomonadota bacterium]